MPESANSLQASFWLMVALQTIGSVDMPGRGPRKLPSPRSYAAIIVTWGVLQLVSDAGSDGAGRAARVTAWTIVLVGMVLGPFGSTFVNFLNSAVSSVAPATPTQPTG